MAAKLVDFLNIEIKHRLVILIVALLIGSSIQAQKVVSKQKVSPIDSVCQLCLDSANNQTTAGMITCTMRDRDAWEAEIHKYDSLLNILLEPQERGLYNDAQKQWKKWRASELTYTQKQYYGMGGTMWHVIYYERLADIARQRAIDLKAYYDELNMH